MPKDLSFVDDYLAKLDVFAMAAEEMLPYLRDSAHLRDAVPGFEAALARLLKRGDRRAPARLVYYVAVRGGDVVAADTDLGAAVALTVGRECPLVDGRDGRRGFGPTELLAWWGEHRDVYERFALLDVWLLRTSTKHPDAPVH